MRKKPKQLEFSGQEFFKPKNDFGGSKLKGNAKSRRPLASKLPIHLTLRAERGILRLPRTFGVVAEAIENTSKKYGMTIYKSANVGNHLHFVLKIGNLRLWAAFIRELTGRIAQAVQAVLAGVQLGFPAAEKMKFWKFKPHTRIIQGWKKAFRSALDYVELNQLEAEGFISRKEVRSLNELRKMWADTA